MPDLVQDAMCTEPYSPTKNFASTRVIPQALQEMITRGNVDDKEMVSIIFLMVDEYTDLSKIIKDIKEDPKTAFTQLSSKSSWAEKLIESLLVIGNKDVIRMMGFNKKEIQDFETMLVTKEHNVSPYINRAMKSLYFLCANLDDDDVRKLVTEVNQKLCQPLDVNPAVYCLEIYILKLLQQGYISIAPDKFDLSNLLKNLKSVGLSDLPFDFNYWENVQFTNRNERDSQTSPQMLDNSNISQYSNSDNSLFNKDPNVGWSTTDYLKLCIIINQIEFKDKEKFKTRGSSIRDEERLEETFKGCGFKIEPHRNLTKQQMIEVLESLNSQSYAKYGAIVLCILSHGLKGEVVFSDDNSLSIDRIKKKFCCETLQNAFKLFILQSCQGQQIGFVERKFDQLVTDGPSTSNRALYHLHFCLYHATITDFAAMRDEELGSWFIRDLCREIQEAKKPIEIRELIQSVNSRVTKRRGRSPKFGLQEAVQVPYSENTMTISYILPKFQKARQN